MPRDGSKTRMQAQPSLASTEARVRECLYFRTHRTILPDYQVLNDVPVLEILTHSKPERAPSTTQ